MTETQPRSGLLFTQFLQEVSPTDQKFPFKHAPHPNFLKNRLPLTLPVTSLLPPPICTGASIVIVPPNLPPNGNHPWRQQLGARPHASIAAARIPLMVLTISEFSDPHPA